MKYKIEKYLKLVDKGFYPTYDELSDYLYDPCGVKEVEDNGYITKGDSYIILTQKGIDYLKDFERKQSIKENE